MARLLMYFFIVRYLVKSRYFLNRGDGSGELAGGERTQSFFIILESVSSHA